MAKDYCKTCTWKEGTSEACDNCYYSRLLEERGIPPTGYEKGRIITNQETMCKLTPEEFYYKMKWLLFDYGARSNNSRLAIMDWLKEEATDGFQR